MSDDAFCVQCGQRIPSTAKFCKFCGSPQVPGDDPPAAADERLWAPPEPPAPVEDRSPGAAPRYPSGPPAGRARHDAPPPPPRQSDQASPREVARHAIDRVESAAPGAGELAGQLAAQLSTPAVAAAGLAALFTALLMLGAGLLMALLPGESSLLLFDDDGIVNEMLVNAASFTSAPLTGTGDAASVSVQRMPMLFILLPLAGMAFFVAAQRARIERLSAGRRLLAGAAGAIPLALLMLIVAIAGKVEGFRAEAGPVVLLTLLWGAIGGMIGVWWVFRKEDSGSAPLLVPEQLRAPLRASNAALRALFFALAMTTCVASAIVIVQTLRDAGDIHAGRSGLAATLENALYAPEHGLHAFELGTFARFTATVPSSLQLPIPVDSPERLPESSDSGEFAYRIFDFTDAVPAGLFIAGLLLFIAIPALCAVYGGFAAARVAGATTPLLCGAFGALTGLVWAIAMVILNAVATKSADFPLWGAADGASVFGFTLLVGGLLGSLGGILALPRQTPPPHPVDRHDAPAYDDDGWTPPPHPSR